MAIPPFGSPPATIKNVPNLAQTLKSQGWSVISTRPIRNEGYDTTSGKRSSMLLNVAPFKFDAVRLGYCNWGGASGTYPEGPNNNSIVVRASVQPGNPAAPGESVYPAYALSSPAYFGGSYVGYLNTGDTILSDPIQFGRNPGEWWYSRTHISGDALPAAPSAPTLTGQSTGGFLSNTTVYVGISYVYAGGYESQLAASSVTLSAGTSTQSVVVTSPSAVAGVIGYRIYVGDSSISATTQIMREFYFGVTPIGTNKTISAKNSGVPVAMERGLSTVNSILTGGGTQGGTGPGAANTGDADVVGIDAVSPSYQFTGPTASDQTVGPNFALGLTPQGVQPSLAIVGDSILEYTQDDGYGHRMGSYPWRAAANQTTNRAYTPAIVPTYGIIHVARYGENGYDFAGTWGLKRTQLAALCTTVYCCYGTNDIFNGGQVPALVASILTIANNFLAAGVRRFVTGTLVPRTASSDSYSTTAGQSFSSGLFEAERRQYNNYLRAAHGSTVFMEAMFTASAGAVVNGYNFQGGGDAATMTFLTGVPFVCGTETIKVNGVTKALTMDYTYYAPLTISGVQYASGVTFVSAPGNSAPVTASYASMPSLASLAGSNNIVAFDAAAAVEVNNANGLTQNGGYWLADNSSAIGTRVSTAASGLSITDSTLSVTQDQYRGYVLRITAGTGAGQKYVITSNNATTFNWRSGSAPTSGSSFIVTDTTTLDGIHPTTRAHMLISQAFAAAKLII